MSQRRERDLDGDVVQAAPDGERAVGQDGGLIQNLECKGRHLDVQLGHLREGHVATVAVRADEEFDGLGTRTFLEAALLTNNRGLVIAVGRNLFQVSIVRVNRR